MVKRAHWVASALLAVMVVNCIVLSYYVPLLAASGKVLVAETPRLATSTSNSDPTGDEWPMLGGQLNHSCVAHTTPQIGSAPLWSYHNLHDWGPIQSSLIIAKGRAYVGSADHKIYCLNAATGDFIWSYTTGGEIDSTPAVAGGRVYAGSNDYNVYCLDAATGNFMWNYSTGRYVLSSPAVASGRVYVGSDDYNIYCLDATTGTKKWNYTTGGPVDSSPAVANGHIYIGSIDNKVYCLDAISGVLNWSYPTGFWVQSSPAIASGRVYIGSNDEKVYCLNANNGSLIWSYKTNDYVRSIPAVTNGRVYVGNDNGTVYCFNATTGISIWNYTTGDSIWTSPAAASGFVYIGSGDKNMYCLNAITGTIVWSYTTGLYIESSPAIANGYVYVESWDNTTYCFPMLMLISYSPGEIAAIVIGIAGAAVAIIFVVTILRCKTRSKNVSAPSQKALVKTKRVSTTTRGYGKPFSLYCALCDRWTVMDGDYIVSGDETCKKCGEPMRFMLQCGACGYAVSKPASEFTTILKSATKCEDCGAMMTVK